MEHIDTPLGTLAVNTDEEGQPYAQATWQQGEREVFYTLMLDAQHQLTVDPAFVLERLARLDEFTQAATRHLQEALGTPEEVGHNGLLLWGEELTFWGGTGWSILFAEGAFPICQPYGVLANFEGDQLVDFDDLSDAEEE